jgi:hypothetical protein
MLVSVKRVLTLVISTLLTCLTASLMLGFFPARSISHAISLAENHFHWMVFFVHIYLGANLIISQIIVFTTVFLSCSLFFCVVRGILILAIGETVFVCVNKMK